MNFEEVYRHVVDGDGYEPAAVHDFMRTGACAGCEHHTAWDDRSGRRDSVFNCGLAMSESAMLETDAYEGIMVPTGCPREDEYRTMRKVREL